MKPHDWDYSDPNSPICRACGCIRHVGRDGHISEDFEDWLINSVYNRDGKSYPRDCDESLVKNVLES